MSRFRFSNRASALVTATVLSTDTAITLEAGGGALMPSLSSGDKFRATLISTTGAVEIVEGTAVVGDVVTIIRAQEGTAAQTFATGSRFELRLTAALAESFLQRSGDTMNGPLDLQGNELRRAKISGANSIDVIHTALIRALSTPIDQPYNASENAITVPNNINANFDARRPGYMGRVITNSQMFDGIVFDWFGDVNNVPSHLKLCNGTQSTPDLRGVFVRGWSATFGVGAVGGAESGLTTENGSHDHGSVTAPIALVSNHLPPIAITVIRSDGFESGGGITGVTAIQSIGYANTLGAGHQHGIPIAGQHRHTAASVPPFFALARVMFKV